MNSDLLKAALAEYFAPWMQALQLEVQAADGDSVTVPTYALL